MTKFINTSIVINATPTKIWQILTHFESFPQWNPFIIFIKGTLKEKEKLHIVLHPPKGNKMTFKPKILSVIQEKELRWLGHFVFPGLFDGEHSFQLIDNGNGTTTFTQSENFKGILVRFINLEKTEMGFIEMNKKLKEFAEM